MPDPTSLTIRFVPALAPNRRHDIEDGLEECLGECQAEITGGGTELDGSSSDIGISTHQPKEDIQLLRKALASLKVPENTTIEWREGETIKSLVVYGDDIKFRPWWKFW